MDWKPTCELRLIVKPKKDPIDHQFINVRNLQVIEQKWVKEGFKDGETYVIETEWRELPEA